MNLFAIHPQEGWYASVVPDLCVSETHTKEATLTENPVEDGSNVTDHLLVKPEAFEAEIYVTNTPSEATPQDGGAFLPVALDIPTMPLSRARFMQPLLERPRSVLAFQLPTAVDRIKRTWTQLRNMMINGILVDVATARFLYEGMVIVTISETVSTEAGAQIHITFKELRKVQAETVNAPKPSEPRGAQTTGKGAQSPIDAAKSDAAKALGDLFNRSSDSSAAVQLLGAFGINL